MKNIIKYAIVAASAAFALVSCNVETDIQEVTVPETEGFRIALVAGDVITKTEITGVNTVGWRTGVDKIGLVNMDTEEKAESDEAAVDLEGKATFYATVAHTGNFYAYYPYNDSAVESGGAVRATIAKEQNPTVSSFDPSADVLVSEQFTLDSDGYVTPGTLSFKRAGAFLKIYFVDNTTGSVLTGDYLNSITVECSEDLTGDVVLNMGDIEMTEGADNTVKGTFTKNTFVMTEPSNAAYLGVLPVTIPSGSDLTISAVTNVYNYSKTISLSKNLVLEAGDILPIKIVVTDADITPRVPALTRVWGFYQVDSTPWYATTNITAVSIAHPDSYGMARSLAMDDDYVYLPKSSGYANVAAVSIADKATQKALNKTGVSGGSLFSTSFVRTIKNTDPSVNGGKDVLLLCNLSETSSDENQLRLYAYKDGVDAAPTKIAAFCYDSANDVNDWRRYGDRFFVTGTWQDGKVYFPSYNAGKTVILSIANGARTAVTQITATTNSPDGIKDMTVYPGDTKLFITNGSVANLVQADGTKTNGWDTYVLNGSSANGVGTWGYNFFEFNGKDYIAYARISGSKAWIEVIEDKGDLLTSLADQDGLIKSPIHSASDLNAEHATGGVADCCVREIGGEIYIAALTRDGGFVLDKMILK